MFPNRKKRKRKTLPPSTSTTLSSISSSDLAVVDDQNSASAVASFPIPLDTNEVLDDDNETLVDLLNDFPKKKE